MPGLLVGRAAVTPIAPCTALSARLPPGHASRPFAGARVPPGARVTGGERSLPAGRPGCRSAYPKAVRTTETIKGTGGFPLQQTRRAFPRHYLAGFPTPAGATQTSATANSRPYGWTASVPETDAWRAENSPRVRQGEPFHAGDHEIGLVLRAVVSSPCRGHGGSGRSSATSAAQAESMVRSASASAVARCLRVSMARLICARIRASARSGSRARIAARIASCSL